MRGRGAGKIAAALWLGLAASGVRAEDREAGDLHSLPPVKESSWPWSNWFGQKAAKPEAKPALRPTLPDAAARPIANDALSVLEREQKAYQRRLDVCDRLEQFAVDTDNLELQRQVEELKEKAFAVYQQRALRLGGGPAAVDPLDVEEKALTKEASRPRGGKQGVPAVQAQVREVKP